MLDGGDVDTIDEGVELGITETRKLVVSTGRVVITDAEMLEYPLGAGPCWGEESVVGEWEEDKEEIGGSVNRTVLGMDETSSEDGTGTLEPMLTKGDEDTRTDPVEDATRLGEPGGCRGDPRHISFGPGCTTAAVASARSELASMTVGIMLIPAGKSVSHVRALSLVGPK